MNIKKIIREEIGSFDDLDWLRQIDPYENIVKYYDWYKDDEHIERILYDYMKLQKGVIPFEYLFRVMGINPNTDRDLFKKVLNKYYKEKLPLMKRFLSKFNKVLKTKYYNEPPTVEPVTRTDLFNKMRRES